MSEKLTDNDFMLIVRYAKINMPEIWWLKEKSDNFLILINKYTNEETKLEAYHNDECQKWMKEIANCLDKHPEYI